jgi:DnaJ-class molecular chaperone
MARLSAVGVEPVVIRNNSIIVICQKCKGNGAFILDNSILDNSRERQKCDMCDGLGRLVENTIVTLQPLCEDDLDNLRILRYDV